MYFNPETMTRDELVADSTYMFIAIKGSVDEFTEQLHQPSTDTMEQ